MGTNARKYSGRLLVTQNKVSARPFHIDPYYVRAVYRMKFDNIPNITTTSYDELNVMISVYNYLN